MSSGVNSKPVEFTVVNRSDCLYLLHCQIASDLSLLSKELFVASRFAMVAINNLLLLLLVFLSLDVNYLCR